MSNIIVTGSEGFIGTALTKRLREMGFTVIRIDAMTGADLTQRGWHLGRIDDWTDTIIHLAGCSDAYQNPSECIRINLLTTVNLLAAINGEKKPRLIFASTYLADDGPYAMSKRCCEQMIRTYYGNKGCCIVNCCNVYGPGDYNTQRVIPSFISKMLKNVECKVSARARNFAYIDDVVEAYVRLVTIDQLPPVCSVTGSGLLPLDEVAATIKHLTGSSSKVESSKATQDRFTIHSMALCEMGWKPEVSFEDGLARTIKWWKDILK